MKQVCCIPTQRPQIKEANQLSLELDFILHQPTKANHMSFGALAVDDDVLLYRIILRCVF